MENQTNENRDSKNLQHQREEAAIRPASGNFYEQGFGEGYRKGFEDATQKRDYSNPYLDNQPDLFENETDTQKEDKTGTVVPHPAKDNMVNVTQGNRHSGSSNLDNPGFEDSNGYITRRKR